MNSMRTETKVIRFLPEGSRTAHRESSNFYGLCLFCDIVWKFKGKAANMRAMIIDFHTHISLMVLQIATRCQFCKPMAMSDTVPLRP